MYDALIIGAGVTGCSIARFLSRYEGRFAVLEKGEDVCSGTSKANSAIIHAGYDAKPGTLMAKMNVRGNAMMDELAKELDIPFKRIGSMVLCFDEKDMGGLRELYDRGVANGVPGLSILTGEEARALEPNLSDEVAGALLAESAGIVCPFRMTIAMAECAAKNGVSFFFDKEVTDIRRGEEGTWLVRAGEEVFETRVVINAAGVFADVLHNMVSGTKLHITPRAGEYMLFDKSAGDFVGHVIFQLPTKKGKGILVTPTVHGNLLAGPTAFDREDREDTATTAPGLSQVAEKAALSVKNLPARSVITSFAGLRAHEDGHEFVLGEAADARGFLDAAGIESPGLSSAPAIGKHLSELAASILGSSKKADWDPTARDVVHPLELPEEERDRLIAENPAYGTIVCRCERVTEGEILDAIRRPVGAKSLDGVKRRTRAGMGRCQAGFCSPKVMAILSRELGIPMEEVRKSDPGSEIAVGRTKEGRR